MRVTVIIGLRQSHITHKLPCLLFIFLPAACLVDDHWFADTSSNRKSGIKGGISVLEDHLCLFPVFKQLLSSIAPDILSLVQYLTGGRALQTDNRPAGGGFSAA